MLLILVALPVEIQLPEFVAGVFVVSKENAIAEIGTVEDATTPILQVPQLHTIAPKDKVGLKRVLVDELPPPLELVSPLPPPPPQALSRTKAMQ